MKSNETNGLNKKNLQDEGSKTKKEMLSSIKTIQNKIIDKKIYYARLFLAWYCILGIISFAV